METQTCLFPEAVGRCPFDLHRVVAPLAADPAWQVESFLLQIFEYGDYSFRSALRGTYSDALGCTFFLARSNGRLIGAAGSLYTHDMPTVALVGPVGVAPGYRRMGVATAMLRQLMADLGRRGCLGVYLGVSPTNPARYLYERLGFRTHAGIVMRRLFCSSRQFEQDRFSRNSGVCVRACDWGDFAAVMCLLASPCSMYTADFRQGVFSTRYAPPHRFLPVFPTMMNALSRFGGCAHVLVAGTQDSVVGLSQLARNPGPAQQHGADLDLFVHDDFLDEAEALARQTIDSAGSLGVRRITCCCLVCDAAKRRILERTGGRSVAQLPAAAWIGDSPEDAIVYQWALS
jgi:ribosomal protein S18 acetylase RimI-like enzyme